MNRFAIVETGESPRIEQLLDLEDRFTVMPVTEIFDELGKDQIHGAPIVGTKEGAVIIRHPAVRALSGIVAVLTDDNQIEAIRDLGEQPVEVAANVRRFVEENASFDSDKQVRTGPEIRIGKALVRRIWTVRNLTKEELAARDRATGEAAVFAKFGEQGIHVAFEHENRLRLIEGQDRLSSVDEFIAEQIKRAG